MSQQQPTKEMQDEGQGRRQQAAAMGLEEIGKYRAQAQQNSADAIRGAEERYAKVNQAHGAKGAVTVAPAPGASVVSYAEKKPHGKLEAEGHGGGSGKATASAGVVLEKTGKHRGEGRQQGESDAGNAAREKSRQAMETSPAAAHAPAGATEGERRHGHLTIHEETGRQLTGQAEERYPKDTATRATDYAAAKGTKAKDAGTQGVHTAAEKSKVAAGTARDLTLSTGGTAADYAKTIAEKAKDFTLSTGQTASEYAKQAAVKGKDATLSTGRTAAEFAKTAAQKTKDVTQSPGGTAATAGGDEGDTTIVGDVLEAVGAPVSGVAQHTKGIAAGEEVLAPVAKEDKDKLE
ncbi:hypothetical protein GUJ93_ZPchr0006g41829 [Zizania palustris]|uniref:Uncharacterized protein n=1 Tax=Zizania palustris TaxID=103762 RepID=A0A8J5VSU5_ZIZPA|nr:hypothetical protein GUJ93_ZPchr0006g41829 [Zizania palustris]